METTLSDLAKVKANAANPRTITEAKFQKLINSLLTFPKMLDIRPAVIDKDGTILGGNMRYRALTAIAQMTEEDIKARLDKNHKAAKMKKAAVAQLQDYWAAWLKKPVIPTLKADDLSEAEKREFIIKDNGDFGQWDYDILANQWDAADLNDWGVDLGADWDVSESKDRNPDDVLEDDFDPDKDAVPKRVTKGDLWVLGDHRLMCGDSTIEEDVDILVGGEKMDMVFTDPPYGVSYTGNKTPEGKRWDMIANDELRGSDLYKFLAAAFRNITKNLKDKGAFYVWFASSNHIEFENALKENGLRVKQDLIWDKGMVLDRADYHRSHESCLYGCHAKQNCMFFGDRTQKSFLALNREDIKDMTEAQMKEMLLEMYDGRTCWRIRRDLGSEYVHPTQKPVALAARAMKNSCAYGGTVLDLFGGSGSTLIAGEQMGRRCRLMEFDPHYCDVILERWEKLTGDKAEKIEL